MGITPSGEIAGLPGYPTTVLTGINSRGDVVGRCRGADGLDVAFVIRR